MSKKKLYIMVIMLICFLNINISIVVQAQEQEKLKDRDINFASSKKNKKNNKPNNSTNSVKNKNASNKENKLDSEVFASIFTNSKTAMKVNLTTNINKTFYKENEKVSYQINLSNEGYLYLIVFNSEDKAICLFPNVIDKDNYVNAGLTTIPRNATYSFPVEAPFGKDTVVALVSKEKLPVGEKFEYSWLEMAELLKIKLPGTKTRGIGFKEENLPVSSSDWQGSVLTVTTTK